MECQRCQDELDAVLIGIADAPTRQVVLAHLASCPDCAREAADLQQALGGLLHAPPPVPLPTGARERLLASARTGTARSQPPQYNLNSPCRLRPAAHRSAAPASPHGGVAHGRPGADSGGWRRS